QTCALPISAISRSEADPARAAPLPFCCQLPAPQSWRCNRAVQPRITRIPRFPEGATGSDQLRAGFSGEVCFGLFHFWLRCWLVGQFSRRQSKPEDAACARYAFHTDTTTELLDDPQHNRQSKPDAVRFVPVKAGEHLEQSPLAFFVDAQPIIPNFIAQGFAFAAAADDDAR